MPQYSTLFDGSPIQLIDFSLPTDYLLLILVIIHIILNITILMVAILYEKSFRPRSVRIFVIGGTCLSLLNCGLELKKFWYSPLFDLVSVICIFFEGYICFIGNTTILKRFCKSSIYVTESRITGIQVLITIIYLVMNAPTFYMIKYASDLSMVPDSLGDLGLLGNYTFMAIVEALDFLSTCYMCYILSTLSKVSGKEGRLPFKVGSGQSVGGLKGTLRILPATFSPIRALNATQIFQLTVVTSIIWDFLGITFLIKTRGVALSSSQLPIEIISFHWNWVTLLFYLSFRLFVDKKTITERGIEESKRKRKVAGSGVSPPGILDEGKEESSGIRGEGGKAASSMGGVFSPTFLLSR